MKDEEFAEMKHAYEQIPIPEELKGQVMDSIAAAKQELDAENSRSQRKISPGS